MTTSDLYTKVIAPKDWTGVEALFESRGRPKNCWCTAFRPSSVPRSKLNKEFRKAELQNVVASNKPVGPLAFKDDEPVAWCSVAPKSLFVNLGDVHSYADNETVWSVTCFFIKRAFRGQGLAKVLLDEAIQYATQMGADYLEAYAVDPDSPSYRVIGFTTLFENKGFVEIGRAGSRRHVLQKALVV